MDGQHNDPIVFLAGLPEGFRDYLDAKHEERSQQVPIRFL